MRPGISVTPSPLARQLAWFIRLRWIAGAMAIAAGATDRLSLHFYPHPLVILLIGGCVLIYNALMQRFLRRAKSGRALLGLAEIQMGLDLICLSIMIGCTGGIRSPILSLFVLHMVFASLLLSPIRAYLSSAAAVMLLLAALWVTKQMPRDLSGALGLCGLTLTLVLTVTLTSRITLDLRRKRRRLMRQNRRIRAMARSLRRHQRAMVRQEKMVAMGQMATGVAHEITNPLASMDSLLQLAQRNPERMNADFVAKLRAQIDRITATIRQMRSLAHPAPDDKQQIALNELVGQAVEMVRMDSRAKRLGIQTELSTDVGLVTVQPQAIVQVIINLLLNAMDAVAEVSEPRLTIRTRRGEDGYRIEVADNGTGIAAHHMNRIFEPFFTTKPVGKGTGLGLSISYNLIRRQGGQIDVESKPGVGTTFTIQLPRAPASRKAALTS
ncbi:MAG TPA: ATP-binding protein [Tepidisphaeraceae bacterium]|nr:ATP-binding protein [Tepidisphaeraceae bacterium]